MHGVWSASGCVTTRSHIGQELHAGTVYTLERFAQRGRGAADAGRGRSIQPLYRAVPQERLRCRYALRGSAAHALAVVQKLEFPPI